MYLTRDDAQYQNRDADRDADQERGEDAGERPLNHEHHHATEGHVDVHYCDLLVIHYCFLFVFLASRLR
jgi:hypothetical protein